MKKIFAGLSPLRKPTARSSPFCALYRPSPCFSPFPKTAKSTHPPSKARPLRDNVLFLCTPSQKHGPKQRHKANKTKANDHRNRRDSGFAGIPGPGVLQSIEWHRPLRGLGTFSLSDPYESRLSTGQPSKKHRSCRCDAIPFCGGGGIRTPGTLPPNSFQDCRHRPLGHTSIRGAKIRLCPEFYSSFEKNFHWNRIR